MNREELGRYVGVTGYTLGHVEKDYLQHVVLGGLSRRMAGFLVFKGGTALQKTGVVQRFSEDLDFSAVGDIVLGRAVDAATATLGSLNLACGVDQTVERDRAAGFRLKIQGPLHRDGRGLCTIRVEISKREAVALRPETREFAPPYPDILPYIFDVMKGEEILAEKLRALSTRQKARDLYDAYMLLRKGARLDISLADGKMQYYGRRLDVPALQDKLELLGAGWARELEGILDDVPPFGEVIAAVKTALKAAR